MILVTGALGYIGRLFCQTLKEPYVTLDRQVGADLQTCLSQFSPGPQLRHELRTVVHLADERLADLSLENLQSNLDRHRHFFSVLKSCPRLERVIMASSCSVYGVREGPIEEHSPTEATSPYAQSKLQTEVALRESGLPWLILRFGTAYGWSPQMRSDLLVNQMALAACQNEEIELFDLEARRPYIQCRDFAAALKRALRLPTGQLINVLESNHSKKDLVETFRRLSPLPLRWRFNESKKDIRNYHVQNELALRQGFCFEWSLEAGVKDLLSHAQAT